MTERGLQFKARARLLRQRCRTGRAGLIGLALVDNRGMTSLEWTLLLAAIALPSYFIMRIALLALIGHYRMITTLNSLPMP